MHFKDESERAFWTAFAAGALASSVHQGDAKGAAKAADRMLEEFRARDAAAPEEADEGADTST